MKRMLFALLLLCWVAISQTFAQTARFYIHIPDNSIITNVVTSGNTVTPEFTDPDINEIIGNYEITIFRKAFPFSYEEDMRKIYFVEADSIKLASDLKAFDNQLFPHYTRIGMPISTGFTPNDKGLNNDGYLDFIKAIDAWGITRGDSNIIIGVSDNYFDMNNPDLAPKIDPSSVMSSIIPAQKDEPNHGTMVAGFVACATNNGIGYPAIGFNCKIEATTTRGMPELMAMALYRNRKVMNASWEYWQQYNVDTLNLESYFEDQRVLNEIYENGSTICFGAGNGYPTQEVTPRTFQYPASLDHAISVTGVGWENPYPGSIGFNMRYIHDRNLGDSNVNHQHNTRVDLSAPSIRLGGLTFDSTDTSKHYMWADGWGTSFASPLVAGTVGLMLSANWSLTPYQIEFILKRYSEDIYGLAPNTKYAGPTRYTGRIGAGALNSFQAVDEAQKLLDYDPGITTFKIKGVEVNTRCKPNVAPGVPKPTLKVILENGTPPYTYKWQEYKPYNSAKLVFPGGNLDSAVVDTVGANNLLWYKLTVYDGSDIQKVASRMIKISFSSDTSYWDLVMRDGYGDMFNERNDMDKVNYKNWNIWESPDLWNRQSKDGALVHQDPEYDALNPNWLYTRIKNVGCKVSPDDQDHIKLNLYWTIASTGETWDIDWTGNGPMINSHVSGGVLTGGGSGIPQILPGKEYIIETAWTPPIPQDYDTAAEIKVCVLGRIEQPGGMTFTEDSVTKENVWNNNNIVTRNLLVQNFSANKTSTTTLVGFGNSSSVPKPFTLQVLTGKHIVPNLEGALPKYFTVTLRLGDLYDVWVAGGKQGNATSSDDVARTVTCDLMQPLRLDNLQLAGLEKHFIRVTITRKEATAIPFEIANERIFVRQLIPYTEVVDLGDGTNVNVSKDEVYGSVNFSINVEADEVGDAKQGNNIAQIEKKKEFIVYPNPVKNTLAILGLGGDKSEIVDLIVIDIEGKVVLEQKQAKFERNIFRLGTGSLSPGTYFLKLDNNKGNRQSIQFVKTE